MNRMPRTVEEWIDTACARLSASGADAPRLDARFLVAHVLEIDRATLAVRSSDPLPPASAEALELLVADRERGVPLAYLLGEWEFWSLPLFVTSGVLVPRPETELLIEWGIEFLKGRPKARIAEIGTGSGCIAIALAVELPGATVDTVEISPAAVEVAQRNIERHRLAGRVRLHEGDLLAPLAGEATYDLIVSNPPYIAPGDPRLEPAVAAHEPAIALYDAPGGDGLGIYRRIVAQSGAHLASGGGLLFELPEDGASAIRELLEKWGYSVETRKDLAGIERAMMGSNEVNAVEGPSICARSSDSGH